MPAPFTTPVAESTPFEPNRNSSGILSTDTQSAIEEVKTSSQNISRYALLLLSNGTLTSPQWIGYSELLPGNNTPIVFPRDCILKELSFSNTNTSINGTITFRLNSIAGTIFRTWSINTGVNKTSVLTGINDAISAGNTLFIQWTKISGTTPSDVGITLYIQNT